MSTRLYRKLWGVHLCDVMLWVCDVTETTWPSHLWRHLSHVVRDCRMSKAPRLRLFVRRNDCIVRCFRNASLRTCWWPVYRAAHALYRSRWSRGREAANALASWSKSKTLTLTSFLLGILLALNKLHIAFSERSLRIRGIIRVFVLLLNVTSSGNSDFVSNNKTVNENVAVFFIFSHSPQCAIQVLFQ